jgi:hypothetical protein
MKDIRLSTHDQVHLDFVKKLKILQESKQFDSQVDDVLSKPLIEEKLVFNLPNIIKNNEHLSFFEEIRRFYKIAEAPEQFNILRRQLEKSLRNISKFHSAFQNSVHNDLICHDRDFYISKDQSDWISGVDRYTSRSINNDLLFELIGNFIECIGECFPELLNVNNAVFVCSILTQLKLPVKTDLKHLSDISLKSDINFLRLMMTSYFEKISQIEYITNVFQSLVKSEYPNITLSLLSYLKVEKTARLLTEKDINCEERDIIFEQFGDKSSELLLQFVQKIGSLWDKIIISQQLLFKITPYFLQQPRYHDSTMTYFEKFFSYVEIKDMTEQETLHYMVNEWLTIDKLFLYRLFANQSIRGWLSDTGKKILTKIDSIINPNLQEVYLFHSQRLERILKTECETDDNFLNLLLLPENHQVFCFVPKEVAEIVMQKLVDPDQKLKNLVNVFILMSLWSTKPNLKNYAISFRDDLSEFVDLIQEKFKLNLENAFQRYTYQQKIINWLRNNQIDVTDVPLIEEWMKTIRKHATIDGNQMLLHHSSRIIFHSNGKMILKDRDAYEMLDENGYLVWNIDRNFDHDRNDQDLVHGEHLFILKRESLNIYSIHNGALVKKLTHVGSTLTKKIQAFREPLAEQDNHWFFVTRIEKDTKLEYFVFNTETLEFVSDGKDDNFPHDIEAYFKFVGTLLKCTEGGFFSYKNSYSLYSITQKKFVNEIFKTKLDKICSKSDSIVYLEDDLHILQNDLHTTVPLSKKQKRSFEIYHVKQLEESFTFLIDDYSSCNLLFINQPASLETIIVPDGFKRLTFYPTSEGAVCHQGNELVFLLPNKDIQRQKISALLCSQLDKNYEFEYHGMKNGFHIFDKKFVRKDEW